MYGTVATVKIETGIKYSDLGLADDAALTTYLTGRLTAATALINRAKNRKVDYGTETVPASANVVTLAGLCAERWVANHVNMIVARRKSPTLFVNDMEVRLTDDRVLTKDVRLMLGGLPGTTRLGIYRVRRSTEMPDDE